MSARVCVSHDFRGAIRNCAITLAVISVAVVVPAPGGAASMRLVLLLLLLILARSLPIAAIATAEIGRLSCRVTFGPPQRPAEPVAPFHFERCSMCVSGARSIVRSRLGSHTSRHYVALNQWASESRLECAPNVMTSRAAVGLNTHASRVAIPRSVARATEIPRSTIRRVARTAARTGG